VHAGVAALHHRDLDAAIVGDRDGAVGQRVRRHRHEQERRKLRREDGTAGRQRIGRGPRGRRDDDAVGAHGVREPAVDGDGALDHAAERAAVDHDVVEGERILARAAGPLDRDGEQRSPLLDVPALEHGGERLGHAGERDIGEKAEASLVDADQRHVEGRELAAERQHGAVAADHDGEVGVLAELGGVCGTRAGDGGIFRRVRVEHDAVAAGREEGAELRDGAAMAGVDRRPIRAMRGKGVAAMRRLNHRRASRNFVARTSHRALREASPGRRVALLRPRADKRRFRAGYVDRMDRMLEAAAQHLLKTLIERYVSDGQPVGSRALSRHSASSCLPRPCAT
jgi:hypothetical protein